MFLAILLSVPFDFSPPPVPINTAPAAEMFSQKGRSWDGRPWRQTMFWRAGGLKWCDDPNCNQCSEHVYGK